MKKTSIVILAGGKGVRFQPLTNHTPKPLIKIAGKSSLEWNLDNALPFIDEMIIVVGYLDKKIIKSFGNSYRGFPVKYVVQKEQLGTAHALMLAKDSVTNDDIFVVYGDDLYDRHLFLKIKNKKYATVGKKEQNWQNFGVFHLKENRYLDEIIEKPKSFVGDLVNIGLYKLGKDIFCYFDKIKKSIRGEYEFTDMVTLYAKDHQIEVLKCLKGWTPLSYPWNILDATKLKLAAIKSDIQGKIELGVKIDGKIILGKGSKVCTGTYLKGNFIIGEGCVIGPGCKLEGFVSMGNNCRVGKGSIVSRISIGDDVNLENQVSIKDSLVGSEVTIGNGVIIQNSLPDKSNIKVSFGGKSVDTNRKNFGAILGNNVKIRDLSVVSPGTRIPA